jgi:hypothetical protein
MDLLTQAVVWLNAAANAIGRWALLPVGSTPGWLSATVIAVVTGVLLLVVFKYTSDQRAIKRVRDDIKANLLALKLFKDSPAVAFAAQGRLLLGAGKLFLLALPPMAVMLVPVALILGQLSLWYQKRPLEVGEEAIVTLQLNGTESRPVSLQPSDSLKVLVGPVRVHSKGEVCWHIKAREAGYHRLTFTIGDQRIDKEFAVGDGFLRVSARRPDWKLEDALMHPWEKPFAPGSPVKSVEID